MSDKKKDILTVKAAASMLKVSEELVTTLLETNEIPGRQLEEEWRTTRRALINYIDGAPAIQCCVPGDSDCC